MGNNIKSICKCLDSSKIDDITVETNKVVSEFVTQNFKILSNREQLIEEEFSALNSLEPRESVLTANDLRLSKTESEQISNTVALTNPAHNLFDDEKILSSLTSSTPLEVLKTCSEKALASKNTHQRNFSPLEVIKENTAGSNIFNSELECGSSNTQVSKIKFCKSLLQEKDSQLNKSSVNVSQNKNKKNQNKKNTNIETIKRTEQFNFNFFEELLNNSSGNLIHSELYKLIIDDKAKNIFSRNAFSYSKKFCVLTKNEFSYYNSKENYLKLLKAKFLTPIKCIETIDIVNDKFFNESFAKKFNLIYSPNCNQPIYHFFIKLKITNSSEDALIFATHNPEEVVSWINILNYLTSNLTI